MNSSLKSMLAWSGARAVLAWFLAAVLLAASLAGLGAQEAAEPSRFKVQDGNRHCDGERLDAEVMPLEEQLGGIWSFVAFGPGGRPVAALFDKQGDCRGVIPLEGATGFQGLSIAPEGKWAALETGGSNSQDALHEVWDIAKGGRRAGIPGVMGGAI